MVSAGVTPVSLFEDTFEVDNFSPAMVNQSISVLVFKAIKHCLLCCVETKRLD